MTCKRFAREGLLYAYNELDPIRNRQFQQHLSECKELSRVNVQIQLFSMVPEEAPSPAVVKHVIKQATKRKSKLRPATIVFRGILLPSHRLRWVTAATVTILLVASLGFFLHVQKRQKVVGQNYNWTNDIDTRLAEINFRIAQLQSHPFDDFWSAIKSSDRSLSAIEWKLKAFRSDLHQLSQEVNF